MSGLGEGLRRDLSINMGHGSVLKCFKHCIHEDNRSRSFRATRLCFVPRDEWDVIQALF